jgi:hypothetical protein
MNSEKKKGNVFASAFFNQLATVLFCLAFYFQLMLLPLVGRAAAGGSGSPGAERAPHYALNRAFFLFMLAWVLVLGVCSIGSSFMRRRRDVSQPLPVFTLVLFALSLGLLMVTLTEVIAL